MLDSRYIYHLDCTTVPVSRDIFAKCIQVAPTAGYIYCQYGNMIHTIRTVNSAKEITVTKNPGKIFDTTNSVEAVPEVILKVDGKRSSPATYLDTVLKDVDGSTWTDFSTYSKEFREEILRLKEACFRKFLWNLENIHAWFLDCNVQLNSSYEYGLANDWTLFRKDIADTNDIDSFVDSCTDKDRNSYISAIYRNLPKLLEKYKTEFMLHVTNNDRVETEIILTNPVIERVFVLSSKYNQCRKEFPMLPVTSISQRNFNMIGILA